MRSSYDEILPRLQAAEGLCLEREDNEPDLNRHTYLFRIVLKGKACGVSSSRRARMEPIMESNHQSRGGLIAAIEPESFAAEIGLQIGDEIIEVNGQPVEDVIDVQFYAADEWIELKIRRNGMLLTCKGGRDYNQTLGIEFEHPTFDIDIRRCNNLCPFCFVLQMPNRMRRALYVKDDDYRYSFLHGHFVTLTNLSEHDWQRIADQFLSPLYVSVHATDLRIRRSCLRNPTAPDIMEQLRWLARSRHRSAHAAGDHAGPE